MGRGGRTLVDGRRVARVARRARGGPCPQRHERDRRAVYRERTGAGLRGSGAGGGMRTYALLAALALLAARLPAQSDPRLLGAVQLYQAGRQDSARAVVRQLLQTLPPTDSVYPQALYTAGLLAADPQTVQTNLQRVVIEYGQSPWADDALLRLAQFYWAQGDPASAAQAVA